MKISFEIENKEYELPEFINIEQFSKIYKLKDVLSDEYFSIKLINALSGCPVEDLLQVNYQQIQHLGMYCMSLFPKPNERFIDRFELDGVHYGFFPNWRELTIAEFVDMDTISTKKPDELLNMLHILAAVMYRPIVEEKSEHDYKIEKYNVETMKDRSELFKKKLDIKYVLGAQFFFYQLRKQIFKLFPSVFDADTLDLDETETNMGDEEMDIRSNFQKTYGWFVIVNRIAGNDFTKHEVIYKKKLIEILNQLS